ncbi:sulfatase-like hydrolase/transferase [Mariniblastus fucicola]|uniref:Arylsulfatase n=1 Tax=Mariniblastus fucicola TaxID=980251 RepID=A0A5B9PIY4_9BACT|nr:sulfatase-like hydrolase/transferase [Mariniblastus fucicola]QEG24622.1 Arylsulfatase precursor [Mariniblastus fucicola]
MVSLSRTGKLVSGIMLCLLLTTSLQADESESPPNIVLIISDDQAWTDYGFMGHADIETPNLDKLAAQSLTFTRGYVPTSLCRPSLASIITGLYPIQHHISGNDPAIGGEDRETRIAALNAKIKSLDTLPKLLATKGYVSFQSGKWWEGSFADGGFTHGMTHGDRKRGGRHGDEGLKIGRQGLQPVYDFIEDAGEKPFFVWYAPFLPHTPHNPPKRLLEKYTAEGRPESLAKYYAMCEWFDETCGQLVDHIDSKGLGENTIVIYVTDNGWIQRTQESNVPKDWNKPFAPRSKQSPSEGGVRTPIMVRWPETIEPVMDQETLVSSIDLAPTILQAAGIEVPKAMTGLDLMSVARGEALNREALCGEIFAHDIADIDDPSKSLLYRWCVVGDEKLIKCFDGQTGRNGGIHKHMQGDKSTQLFDLKVDPHETKNLFEERREKAISLESSLTKFFMRLPDPWVDDESKKFTQQDRLRGSITPERAWWDLKHYQLSVQVDPEARTIKGSNIIRFEVLEEGSTMQIDLQEPLEITKVEHESGELSFTRNGNVYLIEIGKPIAKGTSDQIQVFYEGTPVVSKNPPWSGGFSWQKDNKGKHFIATSCQGIGASIWWPCKDHGYDEPDAGMQINVTVPEDLTAVSNGRLTKTDHDVDGKTKTFQWTVTQPINNYGVNVNIGNYVNFKDKYDGEFGTLDLDYWVLAHQRETAEKHFKEAPRTIEAFEHWFGKYPFYEDSYKLVVVPYLGMEHQSSVTYGNGFKNGYRGRDLSATGVGLKFDFIIVHESGHEWFGNNVSMKDTADMWIHESFTNYSENLFVEYHFTKQEAEDYVIGCRRNVRNESPIIGVYGVNNSGSGDMYYKGGNMIHMMRHIVNDDEKWRSILRGLNKAFWHQTVTTQQVEDYLSEQAGFDFSKVFDQYLRGTDIPVLKYSINGKTLKYRLEKAVDGLKIPARAAINGQTISLELSGDAASFEFADEIEMFELDRNFYVETQLEE